MKKNNRYLYPVLVCMTMAGLFSCKKASYVTDGGLAKAKTSLTTYDYLKQQPYHYFDTTIAIIDHFNLKDSVNKSGTFFAFTDYAINQFMTTNGLSSMEQLYDSISSKFVTQYMFSETITLDNATTYAIEHTSWSGNADTCAIRKLQQSYNINLTNSSPAFNYYVLQYIKVNGVLDGSAGAPANDPADLVLPCQTTGIETSSGTTLHVLVNNAILNKL